MSTALPMPVPEEHRREHEHLISLALEACELARAAAALAADAIASGNANAYDQVNEKERELDRLDRQMDQEVTAAVARARGEHTREMLACLKLVTDLERVGDLISSFASRARGVGRRIEMEDVAELTQMASMLERMLLKVRQAFSRREVAVALDVLRDDAELDRLRNLIHIRHLEGRSGIPQDSVQVLFMAQALERAGDHAKNAAEEICHCFTGHTLRHLLRAHDQSFEQMFLRYLREGGKS